VFGVPTIFVGDRMFWGNDRFELVRHFLEKGD
jgi:2-hydroxychromene-2-carboxylate isomerase